MFVEAIEKAGGWTRPVHSIARFYRRDQVHPGTATLFFVNAVGWALTCKHVAQQFIAAGQVAKRFAAFKAELDGATIGKQKPNLKSIERRHGLKRGELVELKNRVINCVEGPLHMRFELHPTVDLALVKFSDFTKLGATTFPAFAPDGAELKQGEMLCRLGFPFPEFSNFAFESATDSIDWTNAGRDASPRFPLDGMVTRHLLAADGSVFGFEMSTPGLRGQSGGPAFDINGTVWGIQSATGHLDLDFDVDLEVYRKGEKQHVKESAVLHVGHCIHVDVIKAFMRQHSVTFDTFVG